MSERQCFQEILRGVRGDLTYFRETLFPVLLSKIKMKNYKIDVEIKDWIYDTLLDKLYEIDAKVAKIFEGFGLGDKAKISLDQMVFIAEQIACGNIPQLVSSIDSRRSLDHILGKLYEEMKNYEAQVESYMSKIRYALHRTEWKPMKRIKAEDYILPIKRAKYIKARDELRKAKQALKNENWDEILNHLRPAIELAIKEKFSFKRISNMWQFLKDADKGNFPLPSYETIYNYYDQGSHRIHEGKLNTPWECEKALNFVSEFIDRLDLIDISEKDIEEFKKSKAVS